MNAQLAVQNLLRARYESAKLKNRAYSIRAFAKQAGISPATLSRILNGKRKVSRKLADKLCNKLLLDPQERAELLSHFSPLIFPNSQDSADSSRAIQLTADQYQVVSDWRAYAILGLTEIQNFKNDPAWISRRLRVPVTEVKQVIARLLRLEMLTEDEKGNLKRVNPRYRTTDDVANLALKKSHYQNLELARESLDSDPVSERDFSWITFPMDPKKLGDAKTLIRKFQQDLYKILDENAKPSEVYRLAVHFFPLTKDASNTGKHRGVKP